MPEAPLIIQIQRDCLDRKIAIADTLRKAKVAAVKLDLTEFLAWINNELDGYSCPVDDLPPYRIVGGEIKGLNPYHGWRPIMFENEEIANIVSTAHTVQTIGSLEVMLGEGNSNGVYTFSMAPSQKAFLMKEIRYISDVRLEVGRSHLINIVETVRNILLDWTLKMEKANVLGEGMSFKAGDKIEATHVTQNFYSENIGFVGNAQDSSHVSTVQKIYKTEINLPAVRDLVRQARQEMDKLPDPIRKEVDDYLVRVDQETAKSQPDHSRVRSLLSSLKTICEGAAGNLAAQGITGLITSILG